MYIVGMGLSIHRIVVFVWVVLYRTWMLLGKLSHYITCIRDESLSLVHNCERHKNKHFISLAKFYS